MTDITTNIKTGSENKKPEITTTTYNAKAIIPKEEITLEKESLKKDKPKRMCMTEEVHVKTDSSK